MGKDVDRLMARSQRPPNDPLIDLIVDAREAVVEAARWRLNRVRWMLVRCAKKVETSTPGRREDER